MADFRVRNWAKYQHYKDRKPPWIKLYQGLLTSEDWVAADDATRVLLVACLLVASQNGGKVPDNPRHIQRVAYLNGPVDFGPLVDSGFLVPPEGWVRPYASNPLAPCYQDASTMHANASAMLAPELREQIQNEESLDSILDSNKLILDPHTVHSVPLAESSTRSGVRLPANGGGEVGSDLKSSFDLFWKAYPRKQDKKTAALRWKNAKVTASRFKQVMAALEQDKASEQWTKERGRFVPLPATWINARRWEDEVGADGKPRAGREAEAGTAKAPGRWAVFFLETWFPKVGVVPEIGMADELAAMADGAFGQDPFAETALRKALKACGGVEDLKARLAEEKTKRETAERERGEDAYVGEM